MVVTKENRLLRGRDVIQNTPYAGFYPQRGGVTSYFILMVGFADFPYFQENGFLSGR
jgi:hypothetical protein